ncbi:RHS repeat protein, partial [Pseudomonas sp. MWU13-2860]
MNLAGLNINASTTYSYDTAGRVAQQGYPDNVAVSYARNNAGQVNAVSLTLNGQNFPIAANIAYAPFGPLTQLTWGNGLTLSRTYDQDYQLTTQIIGNWQNQYGFDPVG